MYLTCTYPTITSRSVPEVHLDGDEDSKHVTSPPPFFFPTLFSLYLPPCPLSHLMTPERLDSFSVG